MIGRHPWTLRHPRRVAAALGLALAFAPLVGGCGGSDPSSGAVRTVTVWRHDGTDAESRTFAGQVRDFNTAHPNIRVEVTTIPEGDYNDQLQAAATGRQLPDIAEIDGPLVDSFVYQEELTALDDLLPEATLSAQLPSLRTQGKVDGRTYAVGVFDSGLGLYADRRQLRAAGITSWPTTPAEAWTGAEFREVLRTLAARDQDGKVLDLKLNYGVGEWLTYGFAPLVASTGGDLIDRRTLSPVGHLDGPAVTTTLRTLASWAPYVDPNTADEAFTSRRVALSWVGHWVYNDYATALGTDLLVLPLPDLGQGSKSGQGSWAWAVTRQAENPDDAAAFLDYLLDTRQVLRMTNANGAVPGTQEALAGSRLYGPGNPLRLFADQLLASCEDTTPSPTCVTVPRPATPAYPTLSAQFAAAVSQALTGGDWQSALSTGTARVQADLDANDGYR